MTFSTDTITTHKEHAMTYAEPEELEDHEGPRGPSISSGHYSHDTQVSDAMSFLETHHPEAFAEVLAKFPEWPDRKWEGSWLDTDAMGVDVEWSSWLCDAIENTGLVSWWEGEPWSETPEEEL